MEKIYNYSKAAAITALSAAGINVLITIIFFIFPSIELFISIYSIIWLFALSIILLIYFNFLFSVSQPNSKARRASTFGVISNILMIVTFVFIIIDGLEYDLQQYINWILKTITAMSFIYAFVIHAKIFKNQKLLFYLSILQTLFIALMLIFGASSYTTILSQLCSAAFFFEINRIKNQ